MKMRTDSRIAVLLLACAFFLSGCGLSALPPGSSAPELIVAGWTNGGPPQELDGKVLVLEVFATW